MRDRYRREQEHKKSRDSIVQYRVGDQVAHPRFGQGLIEKIEQKTGAVNLHIRFADGVRKIDQKWLLRANYRKNG